VAGNPRPPRCDECAARPADGDAGETEHFFDYIVRNNRGIMDFLDADYTFVNEPLAKLYGIPGITGDAYQKAQVDTARRGSSPTSSTG
jgi:hypothetical protein